MDTEQSDFYESFSDPEINSNNLNSSIKIIYNNPFRVLGLYAESTEREIARQASNLITYIEIGKIPSFISDIVLLPQCERTKDTVDEARRKIEQRESRLLYSLFWFSKSDSADELVLELLAEGDHKKAIQLWDKALKKSTTGNINTCNQITIENAIISQLLIPALKAEYKIDDVLSDDNKRHIFIDLLRHHANELIEFMSEDANEDSCYEISSESIYLDDNGNNMNLNTEITRHEYKNILYEISNMENAIPQKAFSHAKNLMLLYLAFSISDKRINGLYFEKSLQLAGRLMSSHKSLMAYARGITGKKYHYDNDRLVTLFIGEILKEIRPFIDNFPDTTILKILTRSLKYFPSSARITVTDTLMNKWQKWIESEIAKTKDNQESNPSQANIYGLTLYNNTHDILIYLKDLLGDSSLLYHHLADSVAEEILTCSIEFYNSNLNYDVGFDPGEDALQLAIYSRAVAMSSSIKKRAEAGIATLNKWIKNKPARERKKIIEPHIDAVMKIFAELPNDDEAMYREISIADNLLNDCRPHLHEWKKAINDSFITHDGLKRKMPSIIVLDRFDDNKNNWKEGDNELFHQIIDNKIYFLKNKTKDRRHWSWSLYHLLFGDNIDFTLECCLTKQKGKDKDGFGIVFGYKKVDDQQTFSTFRITDNGYYYYGTYNLQWTPAFEWKYSDHILCGNETNILKVQKKNNKVSYFINNNLIEEDSAIINCGKGIGFIINPQTSIEVDYIYYCNDAVDSFEVLEYYDLYLVMSDALVRRILNLCINYTNRTGDMYKAFELVSNLQSWDMTADTQDWFDRNYQTIKSNLSTSRPKDTAYTTSDKKSIYWIAAIIAIIILIIMCNDKSKNKSSFTSLPAIPYKYQLKPSIHNEGQTSYAPPMPYQYDQMPPVGRDHLLNKNQIYYCLSEGVRLEAMRGAIDRYSQFEVDRFNDVIADHNSRCGRFRYRRGSLESVKRDVERERHKLENEGRNRVLNWR